MSTQAVEAIYSYRKKQRQTLFHKVGILCPFGSRLSVLNEHHRGLLVILVVRILLLRVPGRPRSRWLVRIPSSLRNLEMASPLFFSNRSPERQNDSDDGGGDTHDGSESLNLLPPVGNLVVLRKASHDLGGRGRNGVSDLVSDARKSGTELRWTGTTPQAP